MNKIKGVFDKVDESDKNLVAKFEKKLNLSDYQSKCLSFASGFVIGAILL